MVKISSYICFIIKYIPVIPGGLAGRGGEKNDNGDCGMKKLKRWQQVMVILAVIAVVCAAVFGIYKLVVRTQMNEETKKRDSWTVETGDLIRQNSDQRVNIYAAATDSQITVYQMLPREIEMDSFTFYDEQVQERLAAALEELKAAREYTLEEPLAVWNPFSTGSNGLYLYFDYDGAAGVSYTIHVADSGIEDYTAQANTSGDGAMEFLMVGLVPGQVNEVTL